METNQSEQFYLSTKLGSSNIISPAQYPCTVIGSNKSAIHTIVPNISNSTTANFSVKLQNNTTTDAAKIAQNFNSIPCGYLNNPATNIASFNLNSIPNVGARFVTNNAATATVAATNKNKKLYNKRTKAANQSLTGGADNSSDITVAPNQLTILVQEVLPAQDHPVIPVSSLGHVSLKAAQQSSSIAASAVISASPSPLSSQHNPQPPINIGSSETSSISDSSICSPPKQSHFAITSCSSRNSLIHDGLLLTDSRDTISEVIREVLTKAVSREPHNDVFLSVIRARENGSVVTENFEEIDTAIGTHGKQNSSFMVSLDGHSHHQSVNTNNSQSYHVPHHLSVTNTNAAIIPQANSLQIRRQSLPTQHHADIVDPNKLTSYQHTHPQQQSMHYKQPSPQQPMANCHPTYGNPHYQKPPDDHPSSMSIANYSASTPAIVDVQQQSKSTKRRASNLQKSTNTKKQKLSSSSSSATDHCPVDRPNVPPQRCQQNMAKLLGSPSFRKLVHEPKIINNLPDLLPVGCKFKAAQSTDISRLQHNCVKYRRYPFTLPQINPIGVGIRPKTPTASLTDVVQNNFILQNLNAIIPDGPLLTTRESDDCIDCIIAPSPNTNELDYFNSANVVGSDQPISSPSMCLSSTGPNLEMLRPPNRVQSPQLSVFHCPNRTFLKMDPSSSSSADCSSTTTFQNRKFDAQLLLRSTGISKIQISHRPACPMDTVAATATIDSETGEIVNKVASTGDQTVPDVKREKLLVTFTLNPPDDVERTVKNITDALGIDYSAVVFKLTTSGGEISIDRDSIVDSRLKSDLGALPKELSDRLMGSHGTAANNGGSGQMTTVGATGGLTASLDSSCKSSSDGPVYSEKVYKSTSIVSRPVPTMIRCSNCDKSLTIEGNKCSNVVGGVNSTPSFCDDICQGIYTVNNVSNNTGDDNGGGGGGNIVNTKVAADLRCIFIGDQPSETSVILQGSLSKSNKPLTSRKVGSMFCDKLSLASGTGKKKGSLSLAIQPIKAPLSMVQKNHRGKKYFCYQQSSTRPPSNQSSIVTLSESQFKRLSFNSKCVLRRNDLSDSRPCVLCKRTGDLSDNGASRLLCLSADRWVHVNCAIWSVGVTETSTGGLTNVNEAVDIANKSSSSCCSCCGKSGATISCSSNRCLQRFHVPCARDRNCFCYADRSLFCPSHGPGPRDIVGPPLQSLVVDRRLFINRDEPGQAAAAISDEDRRNRLRIGSLIVDCIGQLLPHQMLSGQFHTMSTVYPVGYRSRRIHWSSRRPGHRSIYQCDILLDETTGDRPAFRVTAHDDGLDDRVYTRQTCTNAWRDVLDGIAAIRRVNGLVNFFPEHVRGEDLFGLTEPLVVRAIESLPGLETVTDYAFRFGRLQLIGEMPLPVNATGSMRTEPFIKLPYRRHSSLVHLQAVAGGMSAMGTANSSSSKWQQYRRLRHEARLNVQLRRSKIEGFGLYAARDIDKGTMVIEYIGELIRNEVSNLREKWYQARKQGVYMFRLDEETVIDATRAGDLARYINHSCDPNCYTEMLEFDKESHIVIISNRRLEKGEELTYDYKFDLDDTAEEKIPCLCGARNCRRWMN